MKTGTLPRRGSSGRLLLASFATILGLSVQSTTHGSIAVKTGPDVALTEELVLIADPIRGQVLQGPLKSGRISSSAFTPVRLAGLKKPVALDARGSRLVVLDALGPAVVDVDLSSGATKDLLRGSPLRDPSSVAIAANGTVAIADPAARAVLLVGKSGEVQIERRTTAPLQVEFDPSENGLYIHDAARGLLRVEYSSVETFVKMRYSERIFTVPMSGARVFGFSPRRGLVYVAEESALRVVVPARQSSLAVPPQFQRRRFTAISADNRFVVGLDESGSSVDVLDRPLPVSVTLDPEHGDPNATMLAFAEYLSSSHLLPARSVPLEQPTESYARVLARYSVLPVASPTDPARVKSLFCALNPRRCGTPGPEPQSDEVIIPQLTVESYLAVSRTSLGGKTVQQHVNEKVPDPEQRATVTAEYVARINAAHGETLESELHRRNLVLATPMAPALLPGVIVRIKANSETPAGDLAQRCGVTPERQTASTFLPETVTTRVLAALPDTVQAEARQAGVSEVVLGFSRVSRESLALTGLRECRLTAAGDAEFLITESVVVDTLRYRFPGAAIPNRFGRDSGPSASQSGIEWKTAPGPFVVAYKAVELSRVPLLAGERAADPAKLKPELIDRRAILQQREGELNLPVTHWRFDALVPAPDFLNASSPLGELRRKLPALDLSSHERLLTSARSFHVYPIAGSPQDVPTKLSEARKSLSRAIGYFDALADGTEDVGVGVGEADDEVNQDHQGFVHGGKSAWWEPGVDGWGRRPLPAAAATRMAEEPTVHRLGPIDHGTHVAGIVAARPSSLVPGLAPISNLYLIDTARNLVDMIQDAYEGALIRIFNFSFAIEPGQDLQSLERRIKQHWNQALFVTAAGNDGQNLNDGGSQPPISWVPVASHILGVAATTADGRNLLGEHTDPEDATAKLPGSNFGSQYVQLVAPGEEIHSLGDRQYAVASGTSQAVPLVTAAAAMLYGRSVREPLQIKARLIATSDWFDQYKGKVWGGLLNVERAVMHLEHNVVRTQTAKTSPRAITLEGHRVLTARDVSTYHPDGTESLVGSAKIPVRRILRLNHLSGSRFRIFALDSNNRLTIRFARLEGTIGCSNMSVYDEIQRRFVARPSNVPDLCAGAGIQVQQIHDYVAKVAEFVGVKF